MAKNTNPDEDRAVFVVRALASPVLCHLKLCASILVASLGACWHVHCLAQRLLQVVIYVSTKQR